MGADTDSKNADGYKRYKQLPLQEKIAQLVTQEDLDEIKEAYAKMKAVPADAG